MHVLESRILIHRMEIFNLFYAALLSADELHTDIFNRS